MADSVAVDTNWLIDVALSRDVGSLALWETAREGRIQVFLPALAIAEAVKVLEGWEKEWRRFADHFRALTPGGFPDPDEIVRTGAQAADRAERLVWQTLEQASITAELLELTSTSIRRASEVRDLLKLSAADAIVLSLVLDASEADLCHDFLSRDQVFRRAELSAYTEEWGITLWSNAKAYLEAHRLS